nr:maltokinase [Streptomyces coryli]
MSARGTRETMPPALDAAATAAVTRPRTAPDRALLTSLAPLLEAWLPGRRWFAGKDRAITGLEPVSATELLPPGGSTPGLVHLLIRVRQPGPVTDCYQLLIGTHPALPPRLSDALIGTPEDGPLHGQAVYDALQDPRLCSVLLERLRLPGRLGPLAFSRAPGAAIDARLPARILQAEQSNSSVVYGDALILKVFRRVYAGVNPDLELPLALARAGNTNVPPPVAWFETAALTGEDGSDGGPATLGVLQPFLAGSTDGWQLALDSIAAGRDFALEARSLGRATAEVHTALAAALPVTVLRRVQMEHLTALMAERVESTAVAVPGLAPYRAALAAAYEELADLTRAGRSWPAQRIHGDLHLGQALRTSGGWSLIDFEGEPARPLAERRRPQPPARDVAGMLRSFDYASRTGGPDTGWTLDEQAAWAARQCAAYCAGYAEAAGADPRDDAALLRAYETDKAVYEVLYEARHRPDWLDVPMAAVRRLAAPAAAPPTPRD